MHSPSVLVRCLKLSLTKNLVLSTGSLSVLTFTSRFNVIYHIQHQIIVQYMTSISCYRFENIPPHPLFSIENDQQVVKTYQTYESK